jgi:hypothetical protein
MFAQQAFSASVKQSIMNKKSEIGDRLFSFLRYEKGRRIGVAM